MPVIIYLFMYVNNHKIMIQLLVLPARKAMVHTLKYFI